MSSPSVGSGQPACIGPSYFLVKYPLGGRRRGLLSVIRHGVCLCCPVPRPFPLRPGPVRAGGARRGVEGPGPRRTAAASVVTPIGAPVAVPKSDSGVSLAVFLLREPFWRR